MPEEGIGAISLADAFGEALAEAGMADPADAADATPAPAAQAVDSPEQAVAEVADQPTEATTESPFDVLRETAEPETALPGPSTPEFWEVEVDVTTSAGPVTVPLRELRDGYMRQADYTRKTQEVSRERGLVEEAVEFHKSFNEDPTGFARYLAERAGLIPEGQDSEVKDVKVWTDANVEAEVAKRVESALQEHPLVQEAQAQQAASQVEQVFAQLEAQHNMALSREDRVLVLQEAQRTGTADLAMVLDALLQRAARITQSRQATKQAATRRPTAPPTDSQGTPRVPQSVSEAMEQALAELEGAAP